MISEFSKADCHASDHNVSVGYLISNKNNIVRCMSKCFTDINRQKEISLLPEFSKIDSVFPSRIIGMTSPHSCCDLRQGKVFFEKVAQSPWKYTQISP